MSVGILVSDGRSVFNRRTSLCHEYGVKQFTLKNSRKNWQKRGTQYFQEKKCPNACLYTAACLEKAEPIKATVETDRQNLR